MTNSRLKQSFSRRDALVFGASSAATLASLALTNRAVTQSIMSDYRALVCIFLNGGNDGNNTLIPLDAGYQDYFKARVSLALSNSELIRLSGTSNGRVFGLHPACQSLASLYDQQKLAFVANVGPLFRPTSVLDVKNGIASLPPALFSHSDQIDVQQGWQGNEDQSGWAGRALDSLDLRIGNATKGITNNQKMILVRGQKFLPAWVDNSQADVIGPASITNSRDPVYLALNALVGTTQLDNAYQIDYSRSVSSTLVQATELARAVALSKDPTTPFGSSSLDDMLRHLAKLLPVFKQSGYQRQVFVVDWGAFDTHIDQRGSGNLSQDSQLAVVSKAMGSFQTALDVAGLSENVTTFMMTEFSRTLMPATSNGSDHAWGNHFWVMGGRVRGGTVYGQFPDLVLGGKDDCDEEKEGRFVPTIATDQYGSTLLNWLGISSQGIARAFPNLGNFPIKDLGFMA